MAWHNKTYLIDRQALLNNVIKGITVSVDSCLTASVRFVLIVVVLISVIPCSVLTQEGKETIIKIDRIY